MTSVLSVSEWKVEITTWNQEINMYCCKCLFEIFLCTTWGKISIISTPSFSILSRRILANLRVSRINGKRKSDMITIFRLFSLSISNELRRGPPESFDRVVPVHVLKVVPQTKNFSSHLWKLTWCKGNPLGTWLFRSWQICRRKKVISSIYIPPCYFSTPLI